METIFLTLHVFIALALIGLVLIQKSSSDGFGLGSGSGMNLLSGRGAANLLTRATAITATLFIVNSLFLSILASNRPDKGSILDKIEANKSEPVIEQPVKKEDLSNKALETPELPTEVENSPAPEVPQAQ